MPRKSKNVEDILMQLFEDGYATTIVDLVPGKVEVVIKNLSVNDQLDIEKEMETIKGSGAYIIHIYGMKLLSATMLKYGKIEFKTREEATSFFEKSNISSILVDKLVKAQNVFEKEVRKALNMDDIDKVFFDRASQPNEQKPLSEDTASANEAV